VSAVRAVVTDIEGTTSSIAFVKEVLFPFARQRLPAFVASRRDDPAVRRHLDEARALAGDVAPGDEGATPCSRASNASIRPRSRAARGWMAR
jgi:enolase-phosphatase E1